MCYSFWLAVQELKKQPIREVPSRVQEIWEEFLAPGAPNAINLDSKSYDKTMQNVKDPGRYTFEDAQVTLTRYVDRRGATGRVTWAGACDVCRHGATRRVLARRDVDLCRRDV